MKLLYSLVISILIVHIFHASEVCAVDFEMKAWQADQWSAAKGTTHTSNDTPTGVASKQSCLAKIPFAGTGFQWFSMKPAEPLYVPGQMKKIRFWAKTDHQSYGINLGFQNGWYQGKQDGKDLKASFSFKAANEWQQFEFQIPADWKQPLAIGGFNIHNWSQQNEKNDIQIWVDHITVETDLSQVDKQGRLKGWSANPKERSGEKKIHPATPVFELNARPQELCGVFVEQDAVFDMYIRSWLGKSIKGNLQIRVSDHSNKEISKTSSKISFTDTHQQSISISKSNFGLFFLDLQLDFDGSTEKKRIRFSQLPKARALTEAQRDQSPFGINVHGGRAVLITPYTKAGITWFRDYVFNKGHAKICRGKDGQWNGWPYYKPLVAQYEQHNVRVLGCRGGKMQKISKEQSKNKETPELSKEWIEEYTDLIKTFPYIHHWEIDNEYDLHKENIEVDEPLNWQNYGVNHRGFGKMMMDVCKGEKMAVENGRAGIWPDRLEEQIDGGYFDNIQVANVHHYSGIEPAEINYGNFNTGFDGRKGRLFFDNLRATKKIAQKDGKKRELWLTEFGWDTKAGHIVSHYEQAAFLPRAYMCFMHAGVDKSFWFFDIDSNDANNFFDGCGLLMHSPNFEPKLSLSAMAGLTQRLPTAKPIGQLNVGDGTWGYMFEQDGEYIAALFSMVDDNGPSYTFNCDTLYDFIGNKLSNKQQTLRIAPVYACGIKKTDPLYLQTAYSFSSDYLVYAAVGDSIVNTLHVNNNRGTAIKADISFEVPQGWEVSAAQQVSLASGSKDAQFKVSVPLDAKIGEHRLHAVIKEAGKIVKRIPLRVLVQNPANMEVSAIQFRPGDTEVVVKVRNTAQSPLNATIDVTLPAGWSVNTPQVKISELAAEQSKEIKLKLNWHAKWKANEKALVTINTETGFSLSKSIIPNHYTIPQAKNITLDGDLSDWNQSARWPEWMMGVDMGKPGCDMYVAWSPKGLYLGLAVDDSKIISSEPHNFWNGDVVEILIDSGDNKKHRFFEKGDHQFWLVPQVESKSVYLGQWKQKEEIAKTRLGIKTVKGVSKAHKNGYVIEAMIPASEIQGFNAKVGANLGFAALFTIKGHKHNRNVYWPIKKQWVVTNLPKTWGSLKLGK